jgi:hypothetical protein
LKILVRRIAESPVVARKERFLRTHMPEQTQLGRHGPLGETDRRRALREILVEGIVGHGQLIAIKPQAAGQHPALGGIEGDFVLREKGVPRHQAIGNALERKIFADENFVEEGSGGAVKLGEILVARLLRLRGVDAPENAVAAAVHPGGTLHLRRA